MNFWVLRIQTMKDIAPGKSFYVCWARAKASFRYDGGFVGVVYCLHTFQTASFGVLSAPVIGTSGSCVITVSLRHAGLVQKKSRNMLVRVDGEISAWVSRKTYSGWRFYQEGARVLTAAETGYAIEFWLVGHSDLYPMEAVL